MADVPVPGALANGQPANDQHDPARQAFDELKPALGKIWSLAFTAPLDAEQRFALSVFIVSHFTGVACGCFQVMRGDRPDADAADAGEIAEAVLGHIQQAFRSSISTANAAGGAGARSGRCR